MTTVKESDSVRGCLLGLAVGDAVGTTVEFKTRGSFPPLGDMSGGGPFGLEPGQWTDDTSMALCLAESLLERGGFDAGDQMERYCRWQDEGYLSSTGTCFDIGNTVSAALSRFRETGEPFSGSTAVRSAGNGSIMRLAPVPLFYFPDCEAAVRFSVESSKTTHGASECLEACRLLGEIIVRGLRGCSREEMLTGFDTALFSEPAVAAIARGDYLAKDDTAIRGSGYVVESLEAALWCFARTGTFEGAVLAAANLGDDADTTAAVCGQAAGAFYGASGIPQRWLDRLAMAGYISDLADRLGSASPAT